jgi:hypothetical protein
MYTSLPAVISEYVANAWDAWATEVDIQIPDQPMDETYEITIEDNGFGMTVDDVNTKFLIVGRNRRNMEGQDYVEKEGAEETRPVMGRKGIGKLAGFGVASVINIWTCKDGEYVEFELDYDEMQERAPDDPEVKEDYQPDVLDTGEVEDDETEGTIITLRKLKRKQKPNTEYAIQRLSRRFGVISEDFKVVVNDEEVGADERNLRQRCEFVNEFEHEIEEGKTASGWVGTFKRPVPDTIGNGVVVMTRGKLVQEPSTFGVADGGTTGQQALQYMVGEVTADFLDEEETDLISTDRTKVVWSEPPAEDLFEIIASEIRSFCRTWPERRGQKRMEKVKKAKPYQKYIEPLDDYEQELADNFLSDLSQREGYDDEMLDDMASYISSGVQQKAFSHLLKEINDSDVTNVDQLLDLFDKYEVLDALNALKVIKGRFNAIRKFEDLVDTNAKEVPTMHNFIGDNPWILDPQWDYLDDEYTFRQMLEDRFPNEEFNEESNRRIDFVCLGDVSTLKIVEIKKPQDTIGINELDQLKDYVDYARDLHGTDPVGEREVEGYIVGKGLADSRKAEREYTRMKRDGMYIRTYTDLKRIARQSQREFFEVFKRKAERTGSSMLASHLEDVDDELLPDDTDFDVEEPG